jgi:hypothetical protein
VVNGALVLAASLVLTLRTHRPRFAGPASHAVVAATDAPFVPTIGGVRA